MSSVIPLAVARCREGIGVPIAALAERTGLTEDVLRAFEAGQRELSAAPLLALARALGLPPESFLSEPAAAAARPALDSPKFFHATEAPYLLAADALALTRQLTRARIMASLVRPDVDLDSFEPRAPGAVPWRKGYDLANTVRARLKLEGPVIELQNLLEERLGILVARHDFADRQLRAAALRSGAARLIVASQSLSLPLLRMSMAHELCHLLCDLGAEGARSERDADFQDAGDPEERRAKAFAVMFLAPRKYIETLFGAPTRQFGSTDRIIEVARALATQCGIGRVAALWHLFHLEYLSNDESSVQRALRQIGTDDPAASFESQRAQPDGLFRAVQRAEEADEISADHAARLREL